MTTYVYAKIGKIQLFNYAFQVYAPHYSYSFMGKEQVDWCALLMYSLPIVCLTSFAVEEAKK